MSLKSKRDKIDLLIDHLWSNGYLTLSRKYGKYLPAPAPVGDYDVDAIAKYKKKLAIGLALSEEEINDPNLISKLIYLVNSKTKLSKNKVTLFLGVQNKLLIKVQMILASLNEETRSHIKVVPLNERETNRN